MTTNLIYLSFSFSNIDDENGEIEPNEEQEEEEDGIESDSEMEFEL